MSIYVPHYKLRRRKDSGSYIVDWKDENGRRIRKSLGKIKRDEALQYIEALRNEHLERLRNNEKTVNCDLDTFLEKFYFEAKLLKRASSVQTDKTVVNQFLKFSRVNELSEINQDAVNKTISRMKKCNYSPVTINILIRVMKNIISHAIKWNYMKNNPFNDFKQLKVPEKTFKYYTEEERDRIIGYAKKSGVKIYIACCLEFYAGLRNSEIANFQWKWVDFDKNIIEICNNENFTTKSYKNRIIPLNTKLKKVLLGYKKNDASGSVFVNCNGNKNYRYNFRKAFDTVKKKSKFRMDYTKHYEAYIWFNTRTKRGFTL